MTFSSYPEYKDSGHEWMGEIPNHWLIYRSKNIFSERNVKALECDEQLTASQKYGVIPQKLFSELEDQKVMQVILGRDILKKAEVNDFVISMRSFQGGLEFCPYSGAVSSAYVPLFANREIDNRFFKHLFKSVPFISALQNTSNLVRDGQALRYNNFVQLSLPYPLLNEQRTIGAFLDHETARIDALIEEQQRLIELLKEKRQAVISHAVTKGLDPTVPMKDSGVEWLGEVPAHWVLEPLKYQCRFSGGGTPSKENLEYWNGDIPWVSPKDMKTFWITDTEDKITATAVTESSTSMVEPGALLLVVRSGILQRTIPTGINTVSVSLNQDMKALRFRTEGMAEFVAFLIKGFESSILLEWRKQGATVESIEHEYLANTILAVPPLIELKAIVQKIRATEAKYEVLQDESMRLIAMLQERRSALISAAVTGKIDVRGWQPASTQAPESAVAEAH